MENKYALIIHGGAGAVFDTEAYRPSLTAILEKGSEMLKSGASAMDVVEMAVKIFEDDPLYNAGKGSVLNSEGTFDADAVIMNGKDLSVGAVAGLKKVKNPISLARKVITETEHVLLVGEGALRFAKDQGVELAEDDYFMTEKRKLQWEEAKKADSVELDHSPDNNEKPKKLGTVGAVAMDKNGDIAAATSTGGMTNKKYGRVGDSPIVGAGVWADNETCGVSTTGRGEDFLRTAIAKEISSIIANTGASAQEAADKAKDYLVSKVDGMGGFIVIDSKGRFGKAFTTKGMIYGSIASDSSMEMS